VLKEQSDKRMRKDEQSDCRWQGQHQHQPQSAGECGAKALSVWFDTLFGKHGRRPGVGVCALLSRRESGQRRQNGGRNSQRDEPQGKLAQRSGIGHPRDARFSGARGEIAVNEHTQAGHHQAEDHRQVEDEDMPQDGVPQIEHRPEVHVA
jgi:hypothetical protein